MASVEAFLLPFHWEDVVIDPNLVRKQGSTRSIPARYMVSVDAFDLSDSISVHSAVALACGDAIENVPCSIMPPAEPTMSEKEDRAFLLTGSDEDEALCWWQATVRDGAATQLRALLWCIHHWRGLNDASMRLQLFRCVHKGLMLALAAMHRAARVEGGLGGCSERAAESWRSTIRLVAFVAAHWLQAAEQDLSEETAEANIPLSSAWWSARHPGVQRPAPAAGKQRCQLETPSRARSRRVNHRAKTCRVVEDSDQSDRESSEDQCEAPQATSRAVSGPGASSNSDPWTTVYEAERENLLDAFGQLLRDERLLCLAFSGSHPEDAYLYLFVRTACALLESRSVCRHERARALLVELITDCLSRYGQGNRLCPILVHGLQRHEHVAAVLVDIIQALGSDAHTRQACGLNDPTNEDEASEHRSEVLPVGMPLSASDNGRCGCIRDLITQVAQIPPTELARDHVCARNVARFLTEFADRVPSSLIPYLPLWIPHLDGEAYLVRNALVHAFGQVIQYIAGAGQEGACASTSVQDETKALQERLIQLLLRRLEDVHSLARSRTVQVWHRLVQARCVPVALYPTLESHIVSRLQDKSLHVRRAALQLFTTSIRLNPFAAQLEQGLFTLRQEQCLQTQKDALALSSSLTPDIAQEGASFYGLAAAFAQSVQEAIPVICSLCRSRQTSDVLEAISALCTAYQFQVPAAVVDAPKQILRLGLSREASIRDAALESFHTMYLVLPLERVLRTAKHATDTETTAQALQTRGVLTITQALVALVAHASVGELVCLETVLPELVRQERVAPSVLQCWWDVLDERIPGSNRELTRGCAFLIQCVACVQPLSRRQLDILRERAFNDLVTARWACVALCRGLGAQQLAPDDCLVVDRLEALLLDDSTSAYWPVAAQAAVATLFHASRDPHQSLRRTLMRLVEKHRHAWGHEDKSSPNAPSLPCSRSWLSRLFTLVSAFALHELCFATSRVRQCLRTESSASAKVATLSDAVATLQLDDTAPTRTRPSRQQQAVAAADVDALVSATEPERFQYLESRFEQLCSALEVELAAPDAPLSALAPLAAHVLLLDCTSTTEALMMPCSDSVSATDTTAKTAPRSRPPNTVGAAAALALGRLVCLHESIAERYLRVLFTALQQAQSALVRLNIVVALGDLVARFPNRLEPWTDQLYAVLHRDQDARVRRYMLTVLTHLILNEMVKIKGHWADLVLCLKDPDAAVARLARTLFTEMQRKRVSAAQTLVLLLPDLVCSLSSPSASHRRHLTDDSFREMMQFLLSFVQHERLTESLLERFCYRLRGAPDAQTARRLALCIPLLRCTSERCLRRLSELHKCYVNRLHDSVIADCFRQVLIRARRAARSQELRALVDELEQRLAQLSSASLVSPTSTSPCVGVEGSPLATTATATASLANDELVAGATPATHVRGVSTLRTPASARKSARARARTVMRQLVLSQQPSGRPRCRQQQRRQRRRRQGQEQEQEPPAPDSHSPSEEDDDDDVDDDKDEDGDQKGTRSIAAEEPASPHHATSSRVRSRRVQRTL